MPISQFIYTSLLFSLTIDLDSVKPQEVWYSWGSNLSMYTNIYNILHRSILTLDLLIVEREQLIWGMNIKIWGLDGPMFFCGGWIMFIYRESALEIGVGAR